ncbi:MAG TPA: thermonuclease family protein [Solirubrobacterales bacterium]|nr:thermonuclease family protein [Solirubrobacterales bacterium]
MRLGGRGSVLLLLLAALVLLRPWEELDLGDEPAASATALVTRVVDGDTIEVQLPGGEEDVRYIGVDTPETVKPGAPVDCFGPQASSFNHRLVERRRVRLVFGPERRDQYGRLLAYVYLGDRFVNAELVRRGLARTLFIPPNVRFEERLKRLEIAAARAGRGLWGAC